MKIVAIVQARMGSSRLPGKALADINGKPVLEWVITRLGRAETIDEIWIATTESKSDDAICRWAETMQIRVYRGSESDVLDRFYQTANRSRADVVVRITADCPLIDPEVADVVVRRHLEGDSDYTSNTLQPTFPDGLDVEAISFDALERAWREASLPSEREHVTPYIYKNRDRFRCVNVTGERDLSHLRWTLDTWEDLQFIRRVYSEFKGRPFFGMSDVLALEAKWKVVPTSRSQARNEGYQRSLEMDADFRRRNP